MDHVWCYVLVLPAAQQAEIEGLQCEASLGKKLVRTLSQK
jgi:hypothetical protein